MTGLKMGRKLPIEKEGIRTAGILLFLALCSYGISFVLSGQFHCTFFIIAVVFFVLSFFVIYFYRDPERKILTNDNRVLSPADGKIFEIQKEDDCQTIKIFMSPLDMHIQKSPIPGTVESITYKKGKFLPAFNREAEIENEQNIIRISTPNGIFEMKQIAGILARRIACWVTTGDTVVQGQRMGMIRLGSQVDLSFPESYNLKVQIGDKVKAGVTVLAER